MKSEPSATTMTNETFTRWQSVCGSHLPYVTPSAGCGLPLFRLSGKLFKTEISYKRRESTEYIQQNKADTSQFGAMKSPVPAESGGKLTSPVRTCARGRLPQAALWTQALNCCQRWSAAGLAAQLTLSGSQHGAPPALTVWGSGATREHVPIYLITPWCSFWKSSFRVCVSQRCVCETSDSNIYLRGLLGGCKRKIPEYLQQSW